jgi:Mce-associated membrane protein
VERNDFGAIRMTDMRGAQKTTGMHFDGGQRMTPVANANGSGNTSSTLAQARPGNADAHAIVELAEAEAAEAEARLAAASAHVRAIRLRCQADILDNSVQLDASPEDDPAAEPLNSEAIAAEADSDDEPEAMVQKRRWYRPKIQRPRWSTCAKTIAVIAALSAVSASGYIVWQHRKLSEQHRHEAEFVAAARQGVVTMTSLDFNKAKDDVQRIIESATGEFKDDFQKKADDFIKVVQESKVITKGTVHAAAVESMTDDSAVVLVAATSEVTNAAGAKNEPRAWRLSVTVARDGEQLKLSKVEFVP